MWVRIESRSHAMAMNKQQYGAAPPHTQKKVVEAENAIIQGEPDKLLHHVFVSLRLQM